MKTTPVVTALVLGALLCAPAKAQFEAPILSKIQPNLVNPGGKSIAMGGAFVSMADDATAALANPAGLPQLTRYEFGISGKYFAFTPTLVSSEWVGSRTTGNYQLTANSTEYEPEGSVTDLEFASFVFPVSKKFSLAAYYAVNLRYKSDTAKTFSGDFRSFVISEDASNVLSIDESGIFDMRNEMFGISAGYRYRMVSFGAGINFNRLKYQLTGPGTNGAHQFFVNQDNLDSSGSQIPGTDRAYRTEVSVDVDSGAELGWVLGMKADLYEPNAVALGISYRKGAKFDVAYSVRALIPGQSAPFADFGCGRSSGDAVQNASACGTLEVPDDLSIGISASIVPRLMVALEFQKVWYSNLNDGFVPLFAFCQSRGPGACPADKRAISKGETEDGNVFRAGAEYTLLLSSSSRLSLRGGYYREPAHGMTVSLYPDANSDRRADSGAPVDVSSPPFSSAYKKLFDGGEAEDHFSFGAGFSPSSSWSIDVAGDVSSSSQYFVLSGFFRWGSPK